MSPKLSIIIPVYNTEPYLRECLDSVINQTLTDIEIIIVNDCSPDNSESIILEYQAKDPRIKYIKHTINTHQGGARNTGIKNATGKWITFVDSDDYIDLDIYKNIVNKCETEHSSFGHFLCSEFPEPYTGKFPNMNQVSTVNHLNLIDNFALGPVAKIYLREDIIKNNIFFPEHLKVEDIYFWWIYSAIIEPSVSIINQYSYHYRIHPTSTMRNIDKFICDLPVVLYKTAETLKLINKWDIYRNTFYRFCEQQLYKYIPQISDKQWANYLIKSAELINFIYDTPEEKELLKNNLSLALLNYTHLNIDLQRYILLTCNNLQCNNLSSQERGDITNDKWYQFGQLSRTKKIKFIIKKLIKKILVKLHLFPMCKYLKNKLLNQ